MMRGRLSLARLERDMLGSMVLGETLTLGEIMVGSILLLGLAKSKSKALSISKNRDHLNLCVTFILNQFNTLLMEGDVTHTLVNLLVASVGSFKQLRVKIHSTIN